MSEQRTFVITGSASGIGRHVSTRLIEQGHRLVATDINLAALEEHAKARGWPADRVLARRLDVRDPAAWEAIYQEATSTFGGVDVAMNIAGHLQAGQCHEAPPEEVHRHFDINVKGVIFGTQVAARHMIPRGRGHIVNMSSMSALAPIPGISLYSASKFAVRAFSLAAAYELRPHGISLSVICPDGVATPMLDRVRGSDESAMIFSGSRLLTTEEIGELILGRVLDQRPLEVAYPARRAWLARLGNLFPGLAFALTPGLNRRGLEHLRSLRRGQP